MYIKYCTVRLKNKLYTKMLKIHLFIIFTIKTPQPLAALDPLGLFNREDTEKCTLTITQFYSTYT